MSDRRLVTSRRSAVRGRRVLWAVLLAIVAALYLLPAQLRPDRFVHDDSYFYLQVARNVVDGFGSTFHRITPTNGYHPLWLLLCVAVLFVAGARELAAVRLVVAVQALLFLGMMACFVRVARLAGSRFWAPGAALLAGFFLTTALYGSEAHLNGLLLCAGAWAVLATLEEDRPPRWLAAGALLGLAVLARLDNVFVAGALLVAGAGARHELTLAARARRLALSGLSLSVILLPYLGMNYLEYGHVVPISGAIKSTFPAVTASLDNLGDLGKVTALGGALSLLLSFAFPSAPRPRVLLRGLGGGALLHAAYVVLYTDHYTFWRWYYVAGVLNLAFLIGFTLDLLAEKIPGPRVRLIRAATVVATGGLVLAGAGYGWAKTLNPSTIGPWELPWKPAEFRWPNELAAWMRDNLPPESGVLAYDYPGTLAYFSGLRILPADGLINDFAYNDDLLALGVEGYLCEHGVGYYFGPLLQGAAVLGPRGELRATPVPEGAVRLVVLAPLYRRPAGAITLSEEDIVVQVREVVSSPRETPPLAIWRLDGNCTAS